MYNKTENAIRARFESLRQYSFFCNNKASYTFLIEMNRNAKEIGMYDTFYDSPHGLRNDRNFSTAFDVALLT